MKQKLLLFAFLLFGFLVAAQGTIKTMSYNILDFPSALPQDRVLILRDILNEWNPDIFMVCELESEAGADLILNYALNDEGMDYQRADFEPNQSSESELQQMVFYRKDMFTLIASEVIPTQVRDINHYTLKLSTEDADTDPILFEIFVTHLKSSQGTANKNLRLQMVEQFTDRLETLNSNSYVFFAGDLNLYTASEPAYQELLDPTNAIVMTDPIDRPGSWNNNINFQDIHTQSTRKSSGPFGAGAGGGLDDRFDYTLISQNMLTDPKLRYVEDTYKAFGNNGNCYDNNINSPDCTGTYSQALRDNLYNMSDHLPVVMQLETNKNIILNNTQYLTGTIIFLRNTVVTNELNISMGSNTSENITFEVYNTLGQKLMEFHSAKRKEINLNVSNLANGIYYLKTNAPASRTFKFLKTS